jgi:iron complex transport system permease protein
LFVALVLNVNIGSVKDSVRDILRIVFLREGEGTAPYAIVWSIRLPRLLAAAVLGGALGVSGFLIQTFFRNPIASPFVLGISSGAKAVVAFCTIVLVQFTGRDLSSWGMVAAAFAGSLAAMGFVLLCARRIRSMSMLLVTGIMIGYICAAVTDLIVTFAQDNQIANLTLWHMGGFSGMSWEKVGVLSLFVFLGLGLTMLISKPLSAYQLGEGYAISMGVNIRATRAYIILLSSLLSACVTAFAGPISFVGIAVPHIVKLLLKTSKPLLTIPACLLFGAVFCVFCDLLARTMFSPLEMSISTVTAIFGAPIVISMLLSRKKEHKL